MGFSVALLFSGCTSKEDKGSPPPETCSVNFAECETTCQTDDYLLTGDGISISVAVTLGGPPAPATISEEFELYNIGDKELTLESIEYEFSLAGAPPCYATILEGAAVNGPLPVTLQPGQGTEIWHSSVEREAVEELCVGGMALSCEQKESFIATSRLNLVIGGKAETATTRRSWGTCKEGEYPCEEDDGRYDDLLPAHCTGPLQFADPVLEKCIRTAANQPPGDLFFDDIKWVTELTYGCSCDGDDACKVKDLGGMECLVQLYSLHLDGKISDLSPLAGLTSLVKLDLSNNEIADISPLEGLTNLTELDLSRNKIVDLSPVAGLAKVKYLVLSDNEIVDISPLSEMTNVTNLILGKNKIVDIAPLSGLTGLVQLGLSYNEVVDLSPVSGLTNLGDLHLSGNGLEDITALAGLTNLGQLSLPGNLLADLSPLSGLTNLTYLDLAKNLVVDLAPLVENDGLGSGDGIILTDNPLDCEAQADNIQALLDRGVELSHDCGEFLSD